MAAAPREWRSGARQRAKCRSVCTALLLGLAAAHSRANAAALCGAFAPPPCAAWARAGADPGPPRARTRRTAHSARMHLLPYPVYEDDDLLIVNKPAGRASLPSPRPLGPPAHARLHAGPALLPHRARCRTLRQALGSTTRKAAKRESSACSAACKQRGSSATPVTVPSVCSARLPSTWLLCEHCADVRPPGRAGRLHGVHRLDKVTSGCLVLVCSVRTIVPTRACVRACVRAVRLLQHLLSSNDHRNVWFTRITPSCPPTHTCMAST